MTPKPKDTRIMAEWCHAWLPNDDGEYFMDEQQHTSGGPYPTVDEAVAVAQENDIHGCGQAVLEEYQHVAFGLYDWDEIDRIDADGYVPGTTF